MSHPAGAVDRYSGSSPLGGIITRITCPSAWTSLDDKAWSLVLRSTVGRSGHSPCSAPRPAMPANSVPTKPRFCRLPGRPVILSLCFFCCQHTFVFSSYAHPRLVTRQTSAPQHAAQPSLVAPLCFPEVLLMAAGGCFRRVRRSAHHISGLQSCPSCSLVLAQAKLPGLVDSWRQIFKRLISWCLFSA